MIEIVGMFRGQFVRGKYPVRDMEDLAAMKVLSEDFTGAIWGAQAIAARFSMKIIKGGKNEAKNNINKADNFQGICV